MEQSASTSTYAGPTWPSGPRRTGRRGGVARRAFIDSSVWIGHLSARDRLHHQAEGAIRDALERRSALLTTNLVIAEVHRWLLFRAGPQASRALARIEQSAALTIVFGTADHHARARYWLERLADQRLSYTDAVSFAVMEATRCSIALTFDSDFTVAGFTRLP